VAKILIAEDEPDMAMGLRDNLQFEGFEVIEVDPAEPFAGNALCLAGLGTDGVPGWAIHSRSWTRTRARLEQRGFEVHAVDLAQFAKAEAGPTCLSAIFRTQV